MIRVLAGSAAGSIVVLAFFAVFLWNSPVRACEMRASWYGAESGNRTADGSYFDGSQMIAAHKTMAFGTVLNVRNVQNGRSVQVVVRDRGPFIRGRQLDLSKAAAARIGMVKAGVVVVCVTTVR